MLLVWLRVVSQEAEIDTNTDLAKSLQKCLWLSNYFRAVFQLLKIFFIIIASILYDIIVFYQATIHFPLQFSTMEQFRTNNFVKHEQNTK